MPGSPFTCKVTDTEKVLVSGAALKSAAAHQPATITIDPQGYYDMLLIIYSGNDM